MAEGHAAEGHAAEGHGEAKGTTAHTEAEGGKHAFPPFEKDTFASQLVSLAVAFLPLYLIVSRAALPPLGHGPDARHNAVDGELAQAPKLEDQARARRRAQADQHPP